MTLLFSRDKIKNCNRKYKKCLQKSFPDKKINFENFEYYNEISPAVENADLVIESVPERLDIKQEAEKLKKFVQNGQ